jgi:hypothetical protein
MEITSRLQICQKGEQIFNTSSDIIGIKMNDIT